MKKSLVVFILLLLLLVSPVRVRAGSPMLKGVHIAKGVNASLFNTLNNDIWMGTDSAVIDMRSVATQSPYLGITAEYIHRIPWLASAQEVQQVVQFPHFNHKWEISNERDLNNSTPQQAAAWAVQNVDFILAVDPNAYLILQLATQSNFEWYSTAMWDAIPVATRNRINAISFHYYPYPVFVNGVFDAQATAIQTRQYVRQTVRPWMNQRNIQDGWLTETGFDFSIVTQEQAASYIPLMWSELDTLSWLKGVLWYMHQYDGANYVVFVNTVQNKIKPAGDAWKAIQ